MKYPKATTLLRLVVILSFLKVSEGRNCTRILLKEACNTGRDPVCGTDGNTYLNRCKLFIQTLYRICNGQKGLEYSDGECPMKERPTPHKHTTTRDTQQMKTSTWPTKTTRRPVLQPHQHSTTRGNRNCTRILVKEQCGTRHSPVCGSDGRTYFNLCKLFIQSLYRICRGHAGLEHADGECPPASNNMIRDSK